MPSNLHHLPFPRAGCQARVFSRDAQKDVVSSLLSPPAGLSRVGTVIIESGGVGQPLCCKLWSHPVYLVRNSWEEL